MIEIKTVMENGSFLPKNVRQVGEINGEKKIYIEDYVENYLGQLTDRYSASGEYDKKIFILAGEVYTWQEKQYIFASGAFCPDNISIEDDRIKFTDETWNEIYENMKKYFPLCEIVGWVIWEDGLSTIDDEVILKTHLNYFARTDKILIKMNKWEKDMSTYLLQMGELVCQTGYYIYYVKNEPMQEYMLEYVKEEIVEEEEEETPVDTAVKHFRMLSEERKEEMQQRRLMTFLYTASTFLVMVVFVIGVTMLNNYDKMKSMEQSLRELSLAQAEEKMPVIENNFTQEDQVVEEQVDKSLEAVPASNENVTNTNSDIQEEAPKEVIEEASQKEVQQEVAEIPVKQEVAETPVKQKIAETPVKQEVEQQVQQEKKYVTYTIQKGDSLIGISRKIYNRTDMVNAICELNNITDSNSIKYGQKILLP